MAIYLDIIFLIYVCYNWNFKCKKICYLLAIAFNTYVKSNALLINVNMIFLLDKYNFNVHN